MSSTELRYERWEISSTTHKYLGRHPEDACANQTTAVLKMCAQHEHRSHGKARQHSWLGAIADEHAPDARRMARPARRKRIAPTWASRHGPTLGTASSSQPWWARPPPASMTSRCGRRHDPAWRGRLSPWDPAYSARPHWRAAMARPTPPAQLALPAWALGAAHRPPTRAQARPGTRPGPPPRVAAAALGAAWPAWLVWPRRVHN
jgi:hypothetical protein